LTCVSFTFFDPITGKPRVWYYKLRMDIRVYDKAENIGFR